MGYNQYVTRKRARFCRHGKQVNIPYGTTLDVQSGFLMWNGKAVCSVNSQNACDYFSQNDDGRGLERGALVAAITDSLAAKDDNQQARWNMVWEDRLCQRYRRPEHEDFWLWNQDFYEAPVDDLQYIAQLIGARVRK